MLNVLTAKTMATVLQSPLVLESRPRYSVLVGCMFLTVAIFDEQNITGADNIVAITKPNATYNNNKIKLNEI